MSIRHGTGMYTRIRIRNGRVILFGGSRSTMTGSGAPQPGTSICIVIHGLRRMKSQNSIQTKHCGIISRAIIAGASASQAATPHTLPLRPCVLRIPRQPSAPLRSRNVRPESSAEGVQIEAPVPLPVLAPRQAQCMHPRDRWGRDR